MLLQQKFTCITNFFVFKSNWIKIKHGAIVWSQQLMNDHIIYGLQQFGALHHICLRIESWHIWFINFLFDHSKILVVIDILYNFIDMFIWDGTFIFRGISINWSWDINWSQNFHVALAKNLHEVFATGCQNCFMNSCRRIAVRISQTHVWQSIIAKHICKTDLWERLDILGNRTITFSFFLCHYFFLDLFLNLI